MFSEVAALIEDRDAQVLATHLWQMPVEELQRMADMEPEQIRAALEAEGYGMQCM